MEFNERTFLSMSAEEREEYLKQRGPYRWKPRQQPQPILQAMASRQQNMRELDTRVRRMEAENRLHAQVDDEAEAWGRQLSGLDPFGSAQALSRRLDSVEQQLLRDAHEEDHEHLRGVFGPVRRRAEQAGEKQIRQAVTSKAVSVAEKALERLAGLARKENDPERAAGLDDRAYSIVRSLVDSPAWFTEQRGEALYRRYAEMAGGTDTPNKTVEVQHG